MPSMSAATPPSEKTFSLVPFAPTVSIEPAKLIGLGYECRRLKGICSADLQVGIGPDRRLKPGAARAKQGDCPLLTDTN